ncbi:hypothetical protein C4D60_Mb05t18240 [Musa balbisiana]|uniref:Uncharacterized protein n=1 Tax=Musa balbisiana TaxID=52838 RepID=A0A4S8JX08_MUSBA|nr:hypothetical protein C4D60_Mb05t18240 [Musa balbisiana]
MNTNSQIVIVGANFCPVERTGNLAAFFAYGGINVILAMAAAALCAYVAPAAAGSGIPEGWQLPSEHLPVVFSLLLKQQLLVVLRALIEHCLGGKCGLFGKRGLIMFDVSSSITTYSTPDLIAIIVLGLIGGVFGALFNYLVDRILRTYSIINEKGDPFKILLTITISILTSCCSYGLPCLANCAPCPADLQEQCPTIGRLGNFKTFQCSPRSLQ